MLGKFRRYADCPKRLSPVIALFLIEAREMKSIPPTSKVKIPGSGVLVVESIFPNKP